MILEITIANRIYPVLIQCILYPTLKSRTEGRDDYRNCRKVRSGKQLSWALSQGWDRQLPGELYHEFVIPQICIAVFQLRVMSPIRVQAETAFLVALMTSLMSYSE